MSQIVSGASTLLMASSLQVIVSDGEKNKRDRNITAYSTWSSAGSMAGPLIGGAVVTLAAGWLPAEEASSNAIGYRAAFLVSFLLSFIFWILVSIYSRNTESENGRFAKWDRSARSKGSVRQLFERRESAALPQCTIWLSGDVSDPLHSIHLGHFFPLYLHGLGYGALAIAVLISMRGAASLHPVFFCKSDEMDNAGAYSFGGRLHRSPLCHRASRRVGESVSDRINYLHTRFLGRNQYASQFHDYGR